MSQHPTDLFRTSCGATAPLEMNVWGPGWADGQRYIFEQPFVLVGRHEQSCLRLENEAISRRHAYLQQLGGRVFCVDLDSRTGIRWEGERRPSGWLCPEQRIQIGPFTLELALTAQAGGDVEVGVAEDWDPLQDRANDPSDWPWVTVEVGNEVLSRLRMKRVLVLVGSSPTCRVRLRDPGVSKYHCSLVRTPQGVWMVDLLNRTGTRLNGQSLRWGLVKEGDRLQIGPYVLRVWYQDVRTDTLPPSLLEIGAGPLVQPAEDTSEAGQPPFQVQRVSEPAAAEVSAPLPALPEELDQARQRQQDVEILRQQWADSQAECDRLRAQVRGLEVQIAEMSALQAQREAAQARTEELEAVRGERDRWQAEAQSLQDRMASNRTEQEEWRQRLEAAQRQLVEEREAVCAVAARLDQESATLQRVQADLAARNAEYSAALQRLQEAQEELARSQQEARRLQAELDQALERQRDVEVLRLQLAEVRAEKDQLGVRVSELEGRANSADRLQAQLQDASAEMARLQVQLGAAESRSAELEAVRAEGDRLRDQVHALETSVAEMSALQAQREAAQAHADELETVRGERDRWQAEAQSLQDRMASNRTEQEQLDRLATDLAAAQEERDRLQAEQQASRHSAEQAWTRVADLERALTEATAAHATALEEAGARWESERQALLARLEREGHTRDEAVQAAVHEVQTRLAAERDAWRQRLEGAELQLVWERGMLQERSEQSRQLLARLQAERDHLAARLAEAESRLRALEERSPDDPSRAAELQQLRHQAAREQVFVQLSRGRSGYPLQQTARAEGPAAPAEQARPSTPFVREWAAEEQRRLTAMAPEFQAAREEAVASQERLPALQDLPGRMEGPGPEVGSDAGGEKAVEQQSAPDTPPDVPADKEEACAPSDAPHGSAAPLEESQPADDAPGCPPQRKDSLPEARPKFWRQILDFVLRR